MRFLPHHETIDIADPAVAALAQAAGLTPLGAALLYDRGYRTARQVEDYLSPHAGLLHDPLLLPGMEAAAGRVEAALRTGEAIVLYGDYDVDGVCAVSMLLLYLRDRGARVDYYIPNRRQEGYGLNAAAVEELARAGARLLITVDCGVTNLDEVALAGRLGVDVVVTDHHQCLPQLPCCLAVVNPQRGAYPNRDLCGAGVAFKLIEALAGREEALRYVDLAALATVADIVKLTGENRVLTALGLQAMNTRPRAGLGALIRAAGRGEGPVTAEEIGYQLGPRINAAGRLEVARHAVELLTQTDAAAVEAAALTLNQFNEARRALCDRLEEEALALVPQQANPAEDRALVLYAPHWATGVLGIVAARLVRRYSRPVVLLAREGDLAQGSARSVPGVHLFEMLHACAPLLTRYGGHAQAAGMALAAERVDDFRSAFLDALAGLPADAFLPTLYYDRAAAVGDLNSALAGDIERMEPLGHGNRRPAFLVAQAKLTGLRTLGQGGRHYRCGLSQNGAVLTAVAFGQQVSPPPGAAQEVLLTLRQDTWQGRTRVEGRILATRARPTQEELQNWAQGQAPALEASYWAAFSWPAGPAPAGDYTPQQAREDLGDPSARGILVLLTEREAALEAFAWLAETNPALRCQTVDDIVPGENCLLLAPDWAGLQPGHWRLIILWGGLPPGRGLPPAFCQLQPGRIRIIMGNNHRGDGARQLREASFDEEALRSLYAVLRRHRGPVPCGPAAWLAGQTGQPLALAAAALAVFEELGLLERCDRPPWLILRSDPPKVDLAGSPTYRAILAALDEEKGCNHEPEGKDTHCL